MKLLYLLRHAKASRDVPGADIDRPLDARGRADAARVAHHCQSSALRPDRIVCSPSRRTRETIEILLPAIGRPPIVWEDRVYEASCRTLLHCLADLPATDKSVMVVGHNPGMEQLAHYLVQDFGPNAVGLPEKYNTCGLMTLSVPSDRWADLGRGSCRLESYVRPRDLAEA